MLLSNINLIIHSQGEFSFIISNTFFPNNIYIVLFQPFCHFENSILINFIVGAGKLFSLSIFFCKIYCCFSYFGFQIPFLRTSTFPLFPSPQLHFNWIIHSFVLPPSFFVSLTATSSPFTYLIYSFKKAIFHWLQIVLHSCKNSLTFHDQSLLKFFSYTSIFQLPSFPCRRFVESQTSNLYCLMHSSLLIAFLSFIFFRLDLLTRI